jgi:hypothetical protein
MSSGSRATSGATIAGQQRAADGRLRAGQACGSDYVTRSRRSPKQQSGFSQRFNCSACGELDASKRRGGSKQK